MNNQIILSQIQEVVETTNLQKAAQMLSSGKWIAICATSEEPFCFCLGKIKCQTE